MKTFKGTQACLLASMWSQKMYIQMAAVWWVSAVEMNDYFSSLVIIIGTVNFLWSVPDYDMTYGQVSLTSLWQTEKNAQVWPQPMAVSPKRWICILNKWDKQDNFLIVTLNLKGEAMLFSLLSFFFFFHFKDSQSFIYRINRPLHGVMGG